jgi:hypothetical protein
MRYLLAEKKPICYADEHKMEGGMQKEFETRAPQMTVDALEEKIEHTRRLSRELGKWHTFEEKNSFLHSLPHVANFLSDNIFLENYFTLSSAKVEYLFLILIALEQGPFVFQGLKNLPGGEARLEKLTAVLLSLEDFYASLGGVLGYHLKVIELMEEELAARASDGRDVRYLVPPSYDSRVPSQDLQELIVAGVKAQKSMAEIYVVGGAGDRLNLIDEKKGRPLPAARLSFLGRTLLESLVRDLEAREYLYYKLFGVELRTPIILMTSEEKMNDQEIVSICEEADWFGRGKESFLRLLQPLTPVITIDGNWATVAPGEFLLKPGGHGALWKIAHDQKAFEWLRAAGRRAVIVRQINNPLAGSDSGLVLLAGFGTRYNMSFGFTSCPARPGAQEGMNVLKETRKGFFISNLEYTEFEKKRSHNISRENFPANTNILFAGIEAMKKAVSNLPLPGMIVNTKLEVPTWRAGEFLHMPGARLELTMQNIADAVAAKKSFIIIGDRRKTISVTKKSWKPNNGIEDTPEGAYYDLLEARRALLRDSLHIKVPPRQTPEEYLAEGPNCIFLYHPALGPLYSIIAQKIRGGTLHPGAELRLEVAEVLIENIELSGSCQIIAERVTRKREGAKKEAHFSCDVGRVHFRGVKIENRGIAREAPNCYWKDDIERKESLSIYLEGSSEFVAEDVEFRGNFEIRVPDGTRARAVRGEDGRPQIVLEPLSSALPLSWQYSINEEHAIVLARSSRAQGQSQRP